MAQYYHAPSYTYSGLNKDEYGEDELLSWYDQYSDVYVLFVRMAYETRLCQAGWKQILNIRTQIQECIDRSNSKLSFDQIKVGIKKYSLQDALREKAQHLSIMISSGTGIAGPSVYYFFASRSARASFSVRESLIRKRN